MLLPTRFRVLFAVATFVVTAAPHSANMLQLRSGTGSGALVEWENDYPFLDRPSALTRDAVLETSWLAGIVMFEFLGHETRWSNSFLVGGEECLQDRGDHHRCDLQRAESRWDRQLRIPQQPRHRRSARGGVEQPGSAARAPPVSVGVIQEGPDTYLVLWDDARSAERRP